MAFGGTGGGSGPPHRDNNRIRGQRCVQQALQIVESVSSVVNTQEDLTNKAENDGRNYQVNSINLLTF